MRQQVGGYGVDLLTRDELKQELNGSLDAAIRELARGLDFQQYANNAIGGVNSFTIPGPQSGYMWSMKLIGVSTSAAAQFSVYPGDSNLGAPINTGATIANAPNFDGVSMWGSNSGILKDRNLTVFCGGATISRLLLVYLELPVEMQGKL